MWVRIDAEDVGRRFWRWEHSRNDLCYFQSSSVGILLSFCVHKNLSGIQRGAILYDLSPVELMITGIYGGGALSVAGHTWTCRMVD